MNFYVSIFWLLGEKKDIMNVFDVSFCRLLFIYFEAELLDHRVALCITLLKKTKKKQLPNYSPKSLYHFAFQQAMHKTSKCCIASQLLMLPVFPILAFLTSVYLCLILFQFAFL